MKPLYYIHSDKVFSMKRNSWYNVNNVTLKKI